MVTIGSHNIKMAFEGGNKPSTRMLHGHSVSRQVTQDAELSAGMAIGLIRRKNFNGDIAISSTVGFIDTASY